MTQKEKDLIAENKMLTAQVTAQRALLREAEQNLSRRAPFGPFDPLAVKIRETLDPKETQMATIEELASRATAGKWHVAGNLHVRSEWPTDEAVCRCERPEDAAFIVALRNAWLVDREQIRAALGENNKEGK